MPLTIYVLSSAIEETLNPNLFFGHLIFLYNLVRILYQSHQSIQLKLLSCNNIIED
jgi:hypothetical protein